MNFSRSQIKKILIFRFGAIGDVVHSSALFRAIKKFNSELKIDYLTTAVPAALIKNDPDLNKVIILENKSYKYLVKLASELRKEEYDLCINLQPSIRTRFFSCLIKAERTLVYKKSFKLHAVENFWQTALPLFKNIKPEDNLSLFLPCEAKEKILSQIDKKFVVFNMGVSHTRQGRRKQIIG